MEEEKRYYLTKEGLAKIKKEYEELRQIKLSKAKGDVPRVLQSEDLNAEYLAFQEDMGFLDSKIVELEHILKNTEIIKNPNKEKQGSINLGATVLVDVNGQSDEFTIIGTLEANPALGKISNESPVGSALLGHKIGEEVAVSSPVKTIYKIKKIKYHIG